MSTSPVSPEDIRAAAEVHQELGPEYSDAVVASFIDKVEREVAARVEARLAAVTRTRVATRGGRGMLVKGIAIGVCAGALMGVASVGHFSGGGGPAPQQGILGPPGGGIQLLPYMRAHPNTDVPPPPARPP
jgi:hypothetical protein